MKKILVVVVLFFMFISNISASTNSANSYILMDMNSGRVLDAKNKDSPMLIASITNIMTT